MNFVNEFLDAVREVGVDFIPYAYTDTDYSYRYLCIDLEATENNIMAFEDAKSKILEIAEEFGFNAESREIGRIEFAVPFAKSNLKGGYDYLENSESLNEAVNTIQKAQLEKVQPKVFTKTERKTLSSKFSEVWKNPSDRKQVICISCVACVLSVVGAITLEYYKNRKNNPEQAKKSKKVQIAEASKKAFTSPKTLLTTVCLTVLVGGLALCGKMSTK